MISANPSVPMNVYNPIDHLTAVHGAIEVLENNYPIGGIMLIVVATGVLWVPVLGGLIVFLALGVAEFVKECARPSLAVPRGWT